MRNKYIGASKSIQITLDLYSHIAPALQEEAAKAFDKGFSEDLGSKQVAKVENYQTDGVR